MDKFGSSSESWVMKTNDENLTADRHGSSVSVVLITHDSLVGPNSPITTFF